MDRDVAVVAWGEFGRTPRINTTGGRDHWPNAGCVLLAGGVFQSGQVIDATDAWGAEAVESPYTAPNVLAALYHVLRIDPGTTVRDLSGRPHYLLDDRNKIQQLL